MIVFQKYPNDKEASVWKNQAERREAMATVPPEFKSRKSINVIAECANCKFWFDGKIKIKKGMLISPVLLPKETIQTIKEIKEMI